MPHQNASAFEIKDLRAPGAALEIREAFPYDTAPRYLIFDRDSIFSSGSAEVEFIKVMGTKPVRDRMPQSLALPRRDLKQEISFEARTARKSQIA